MTKNFAQKYTSIKTLGWSFLLWGLYKVDLPFFRHLPYSVLWGYEIGSLFAFITAVSMILLIDEQAGRERDVSTERFSTLFKYTKDLILFIGLDGRIIDANNAAVEKYGYPKDELLKMNIFQLCCDDDCQIVDEQIHKADQEGATFETVHERKGGFPFPVEINSVGATIGGERVLMNIIRDITERKHAESLRRKLNFTDSLTGLANRRYLEENLQAFDNSDYLPISVIIGDMNGLRLINDALGHKIGDDLLKEMARLLLNSCSPEDLVIRWGGDEFLLFLPNTNAKTAEHLCQKIKLKCLETPLVPMRPSIALGYAIKESASLNVMDVIKMADDRMYRNKLLESDSSRNAIISSLQNSLFERSYETEQHAERLKTLAFELGRKIGLASNQLDDLALLATLHDVGKLAIPEEILSKPGPLSPEEWVIMMKHPSIGHRIIKAIPDMAHIAKAILAHHERWDGTGYPQGLKQTEIPLISRIISIVDSYDAMTNKRIYQEAISPEQALAEIAKCAGSQFDPDLAKVFLVIFQNR
ncbi:MAG TPA: HD domain-containing phosphohydrolase [Bacillota bacterium]|nr:HD domain-containing phosphohydrolase [Bacillota bacterium]